MGERAPRLSPVDFDPFAESARRELVLPLTEPQAELWTAAAMGREANCSFNQCFAFTLDGPLRVESLRTALNGVVGRHEALRAAVAADGSGQKLRPPLPVELPLLDLSPLEPAARERELEALLERECETPFDLAEGPLVRGFVARESAERHRLVVTAHHFVCDGWSSAVLFSELGRLYAADRVGIPAQLAPAASYRAYVEERTGADYRRTAAADEDYWAAQFPDGAPVLELPLGRPRPARKTYGSRRELLRIENELYVALRSAGAKSGATVFATLVAAFEALVHRLSGQSDFVVGIPFAEQPQLENPSLVAHCVHTLPLRALLDPKRSFADHLRGVRHALAEAQDHPRLTFGSLVRRLGLPRDPSRTPLVSVTFSIDKVGAAFDFGDVTIASLATPKSYSNFELQVNVVDSGADALVECDYNVDLFDAATVREWLAHFETILRAVVADPEQTLEELPPLREGDAAPAASAPAVFPPSGCLHERFEERVRAAPERVALVCQGEALSYDELERRANGLAWRLRELGVGPGVLVGLRSERSLGLVVGLLAILKAGGAYLPLDPAYPRERVEFMLTDSAVRVVVCEPEFTGDVAGNDRELVLLEDEWPEAAEPPATGATPDDLAYVIYTSGSTGKPKGVAITHYNVTRLFDATDEWFGFGADDVWTLFHSYAFDFSVWELWGALLHGGRLVVVPYWLSRSPNEFRQLLLREQVTVLNQTPSAFRQLIQADVDAGPPEQTALRCVVFGGEALDLAALRPWIDRHGDEHPRLVNMYGITETTVHVTYRPISRHDLNQPGASPIGIPIPDLHLQLLDPQGRRVPAGVPGEIHVGGAGVARGYLNRTELTAERFLPDPGNPGGRLYRSGDLARRTESGELVYLGRIDDQIKIRGFRIELGEIAANLQEHPDVAHAHVQPHRHTSTDTRLVAYVVATHHDDPPGARELKAHLESRLPDYMVPSHYVAVPALPLTANGKIDVAALPAPDYEAAGGAATRVAPRTSTEARIAEIWADALGGANLGVEDDFFDLGGHSMMAAQIVARLRSTFGVDVAMRHLFEEPTVAGLATVVDLLAVSATAGAASEDGAREEIEL